MAKSDFMLMSIQLVIQLQKWIDEYPEFTNLTKDQLIAIREAKDIIDHTNVRLARKDSATH